MRAFGGGLDIDSTNASTLRSRRRRAKLRAAKAKDRPSRDARVLASARALVASAARDDWSEALSRWDEICALYNPDKHAPIAGVEVLLRSLAWMSDGAWGEPVEDFGDAASLLLDSSFAPDGVPRAEPQRRIADAQELLYVALVDRAPASPDSPYLHVLAIVDGMSARIRPHALSAGVPEKPFRREATSFVRRFSRELGGGEEAEFLARLVANWLRHPGQKIGIPKARRLKHPLSVVVLTDDAWRALRRSCLGGNGRDSRASSAELIAPSVGGSGHGALERAFETVAEFPQVFVRVFQESISNIAQELEITPSNARVLVRAWTAERLADALSRSRAGAPAFKFWLVTPMLFGFGDERDEAEELAPAYELDDDEFDEIPF